MSEAPAQEMTVLGPQELLRREHVGNALMGLGDEQKPLQGLNVTNDFVPGWRA